MIGNNEAALKATFATITKFMSQSQSEIKFITDVIQAISGNRAAALNKTATEAIGNVTRQVGMVQNNTNSFAQNLTKTVTDAIASNKASVDKILASVNDTGNANVDQVAALINDMTSKNSAAFSEFDKQINSSTALVSAAASTTDALVDMVNGMPNNASKHQQDLVNALNSAIQFGQSNLTKLQQDVETNFTAMKNRLQTEATNFANSETEMISKLSTSLSNSTAAFNSNVTGVNTMFTNLVSVLNTNISLAQSALNDMEARLSAARTNVDNSYSTAVSASSSKAKTVSGDVKTELDNYADIAKKSVLDSIASAVDEVNRNVSRPIEQISSDLSYLEVMVGNLTNTVNSLKGFPQTVILNANRFSFMFKSELDMLRDSIITLGNSTKSEEYKTKISQIFSNSTGLKIDEMSGDTGVARLIYDLGKRINDSTTSADNKVDSAVVGILSKISEAGSGPLNSTTNSYKVKIQKHVQDTNKTATRIVMDAYNQMNVTYEG
jgi:flagellar biosynthesis chaperone FliJ